MSNIFIYGEEEIEHLKSVDSALGAVIDEIRPVERKVTPDLFTALVNSIVGQQISSKAFDTVGGDLRSGFQASLLKQCIARL